MINILQPTLGVDELAAAGDVFASSWVDRERMTPVGSWSEGILDAFAGAPAWHIASPLSKRALYVGVRERTDGRER